MELAEHQFLCALHDGTNESPTLPMLLGSIDSVFLDRYATVSTSPGSSTG